MFLTANLLRSPPIEDKDDFWGGGLLFVLYESNLEAAACLQININQIINFIN